MVPTLLVIIVACIALAVWLRGDPNRPRFVPARSLVVRNQFDYVSYEFLTPRPFAGGKMWIASAGAAGWHTYLFDLENRALLGELLHARPLFMNGDQTKVVCSERAQADHPFRAIVRSLLARLTGGRIRTRPMDDAETFWLVDLEKDSAVLLGSVPQLRGAGSALFPSPNFDRGYIISTVSTGSFGQPGFYICDLPHEKFTEVKLDGWPAGWWDNHTILFKGTNNDFLLYDVAAKTTSTFLNQNQISKAFSEAKLTDKPTTANAFLVWNGRENDVFLTDTHNRWLATNSYLFKAERPAGALKLVSRDFKFEWSDHFNSAETLYLYSGREAGQRSSAVLLRDLIAGTNWALVPDDGGKAFSIPQFYGDSVIYVRSNKLWQVDLSGANMTRLFPPESH
jgi:hypothetical protein